MVAYFIVSYKDTRGKKSGYLNRVGNMNTLYPLFGAWAREWSGAEGGSLQPLPGDYWWRQKRSAANPRNTPTAFSSLLSLGC